MNHEEFLLDASVLPPGSSSVQMDSTMLRAPEHHYTIASLQDIAGGYSTILPAPSAVPLDRSTIRKSPDEEEMEDTEESQWTVRVGDAPPPAWGKRKASGDDETDVNKKVRLHR